MNSETIKWSELDAEAKDRLVATKIMGWTGGECDGEIGEQPISPDGWYCQRCGYDGSWGDDFIHEERPPRYTQSMDRAWEVIRMLYGRLLFSKRREFYRILQRLVTDTTNLEPGTLVDWPDVLWLLTPEMICQAALRTIGSNELS